MFCIQVNAVSNATHMIVSKASWGGGQLEVQVIKEGDPTDSNINCSTRSIYRVIFLTGPPLNLLSVGR